MNKTEQAGHDHPVCPKCKAELCGDLIPQEYKDAGYYGDGLCYSSLIAVEIPEIYDGVSYFVCPACGYRENRWPVGTSRYNRTRAFMEATA